MSYYGGVCLKEKNCALHSQAHVFIIRISYVPCENQLSPQINIRYDIFSGYFCNMCIKTTVNVLNCMVSSALASGKAAHKKNTHTHFIQFIDFILKMQWFLGVKKTWATENIRATPQSLARKKTHTKTACEKCICIYHRLTTALSFSPVCHSRQLPGVRVYSFHMFSICTNFFCALLSSTLFCYQQYFLHIKMRSYFAIFMHSILLCFMNFPSSSVLIWASTRFRCLSHAFH